MTTASRGISGNDDNPRLAHHSMGNRYAPNNDAVKRGRGRPTEGERVEVRIPADLLKRVQRDADRAAVTRAEQIRRIIAWNYESSAPQ